jgi:hypothetical protein
VAVHGVVVLLIGVGEVIESALVEPFYQQLEAVRVVVGKVEAILPAVAVRIAQQLVLGGPRVVAQEVAVQRPVSPGLVSVHVNHWVGEQSVTL